MERYVTLTASGTLVGPLTTLREPILREDPGVGAVRRPGPAGAGVARLRYRKVCKQYGSALYEISEYMEDEKMQSIFGNCLLSEII